MSLLVRATVQWKRPAVVVGLYDLRLASSSVFADIAGSTNSKTRSSRHPACCAGFRWPPGPETGGAGLLRALPAGEGIR